MKCSIVQRKSHKTRGITLFSNDILVYCVSMRILAILCIVLMPAQVCAQEVSFLIEEVFASSPVEPTEDVGGVTGRQARDYREQLRQGYEEQSSDSLLNEDTVSGPVEVSEPVEQVEFSSESSSSVEAASSAFSEEETVPVRTYVPPPPDQQEQDRLTLEQLDEYRDEAYANKEEQMEMLEAGFSITSTSSLGSPLSSNQRAAILRRSVRTVPQLKLFARALAESDDNLRKIEVGMDGIRISYRKKAWLFGFIPLHYIFDIQVSDEGVAAKQPWWHVLAKDGVAEDLEALNDMLASDTEEDSEGHDELQHVLDTTKTVLEAIAGFFAQSA